MTSSQGAIEPASEAAVIVAVQDQVSRCAGYHDSVTLRCEDTLINRHTASIHGEFVSPGRRTEIGRLSANSLVAETRRAASACLQSNTLPASEHTEAMALAAVNTHADWF